jgi:hypothetical protein
MRLAQMATAILGMVLLLRYGIVRVPGWGEGSSTQPVHWEWHTGPALLGVLCIVVALGLIWARDRV